MRRIAGNTTVLPGSDAPASSVSDDGDDEDDALAEGVHGDVAGTTTPSEEAEAHAPEGSIEPATSTTGDPGRAAGWVASAFIV